MPTPSRKYTKIPLRQARNEPSKAGVACANPMNSMLFFDEADALFPQRLEVHDAHDRNAKIDVAYLLLGGIRSRGSASSFGSKRTHFVPQ
jgi:hypothetical protein